MPSTVVSFDPGTTGFDGTNPQPPQVGARGVAADGLGLIQPGFISNYSFMTKNHIGGIGFIMNPGDTYYIGRTNVDRALLIIDIPLSVTDYYIYGVDYTFDSSLGIITIINTVGHSPNGQLSWLSSGAAGTLHVGHFIAAGTGAPTVKKQLQIHAATLAVQVNSTVFVKAHMTSHSVLQATKAGSVLTLKGRQLKATAGKVLVGAPALFATDGTYRRWAVVPYNQQVHFTNEANPLQFTDGSTIYAYPKQPAGRYLEVFYDHLVVGWPVYKGVITPTEVRWSDLYRFNVWEPDPTNEADTYDIQEWCKSDFPMYGCTGLGRINTNIWIYTPTAIISMRYTGKPKVMMIGERVIKDVGNALRWGMVTHKDVHYFWDGVEQDFFKFDGQSVESIGIKIKGYFLTTINTTWELFQATWAYVRPEAQEIVWCFVSNAQTTLVFDKAIAFNYKTSKWYTISVENVQAYTASSLASGRANILPGTADTLTGTSDRLLIDTIPTPSMWGDGTGNILREEVATDADGALLAQDTPVLETRDYYYDDLDTIKEDSSCVIHAGYPGFPAKDGVGVELSVRRNLDDPVVYPTPAQWKNTLQEQRLGLPRTSGRVMRWRFKPSATTPRNFTWGGFVEKVRRSRTDA